jgi:prepilin-type N-terminal cleavage/methylation domain-containing protein
MFKRASQLGFTLIELMVVVAIIGILMAAGLVAFRNAQVSSRDAARQSDISAISKAAEQYYNATNAYPTAIGTIGTSTYFASGIQPKDPKSKADYTFSAPVGGASYCACATLETLGKGNASALPTTAGVCNTTAPAAGAQGYFCISSQQ